MLIPGINNLSHLLRHYLSLTSVLQTMGTYGYMGQPSKNGTWPAKQSHTEVPELPDFGAQAEQMDETDDGL